MQRCPPTHPLFHVKHEACTRSVCAALAPRTVLERIDALAPHPHAWRCQVGPLPSLGVVIYTVTATDAIGQR